MRTLMLSEVVCGKLLYRGNAGVAAEAKAEAKADVPFSFVLCNSQPHIRWLLRWGSTSSHSEQRS